MNKRHYEHTLPNIRGSLSNAYDLRITDLMQAFHTNRTYISRFINREYGMNFSRYINMLRLREMEALRNDPACSRLPEEERACLAGFSNFRSYQRVKRMAEKEK